MMISVAKTIEPWISRVASNTRCSMSTCCSAGLARFSRRRRTMFSTTMIASSTSAPSAMAMPPSVMVLMVAPSAFIDRIAATSDSGMATRVIAVARADSRKANTMATTSTAPSSSALHRLSMETRMKSAWRKMWRSIFMPVGSPAWISSSVASRRSVSSSVLAPGCFWMPSTTAGLPLCEPTPRVGAGPMADLGDVPHQHRLSVALGDHRLGDVVQRRDAPQALDQVFLPASTIEAGRGVLVGVAQRLRRPGRRSGRRPPAVRASASPGTAGCRRRWAAPRPRRAPPARGA